MTDAEIAMLPVQTLKIWFKKSCKIGPVSQVTSDSSIEDGYTYIAGGDRVRLTFS